MPASVAVDETIEALVRWPRCAMTATECGASRGGRRDTWWHVRIFSRSTLVPKHTLSTPPPRPVALAPQLVLAGFPTEARHRR